MTNEPEQEREIDGRDDGRSDRDSDVILAFEDFIRTRDEAAPPDPDTLAERLPDDESKRSFRELVQSYSWTEERMPRNVVENVVLADRFRLIDRLGVGGMGQVWRAEDQKLGREVAVKVMSLVGSGSIDSEAAFERETHLLAQLKHPGIVTVLDSDRDAEHRFLVMDLIEGRSLETVLEALRAETDLAAGVKGRSAADLLAAVDQPSAAGHEPLVDDEDWCDTVAKIFVETLLTLEAAHARRVVHRDLKPGNLMIGPGGRPVLLDFGLGGTMDGGVGELTSSLFGTFRFVAPEQLSRGSVGTDVRTDVYQLGVVFYEFLTLQQCFGMEERAELMQSILKGAFVRPRVLDRNIPRDLEDICLRATDVDPVHRYQSAREFREALQRYLRRESVHADSYGLLGRLARRSRSGLRRHKPWVWASVGVVLAATASAFATHAFGETVSLEALAPTPDGDRRFLVDIAEPRFLAGIYRVEHGGQTFYRPADLSFYRPADLSAAGEDGTLFLEAGRHTLVAAVPPNVPKGATAFDLTCSLAPTAALLSRLRTSIRAMRGAIKPGQPGVDQAWMRAHWNPKVRDHEAPDLPLEVFFGGAEWERSGVEGRRIDLNRQGSE